MLIQKCLGCYSHPFSELASLFHAEPPRSGLLFLLSNSSRHVRPLLFILILSNSISFYVCVFFYILANPLQAFLQLFIRAIISNAPIVRSFYQLFHVGPSQLLLVSDIDPFHFLIVTRYANMCL